MQILELTIYLHGRWFSRHLGCGAENARWDELVTADVTACLAAVDPTANPSPRVLRVEFPVGCAF